MIDLHLHLDGSLPPSLLLKLAREEGVVLPGKTEKALIPFLTAPKDCQSLNEYLEKFSLPVSCMQSSATLREAARGLAHELAAQGLVYAEIRFAPQLHQQKGLTQKQVIEAVLLGLRLAEEEVPTLKTNLILCCMRGADNQEANRETVELAAEFREAQKGDYQKGQKGDYQKGQKGDNQESQKEDNREAVKGDNQESQGEENRKRQKEDNQKWDNHRSGVCAVDLAGAEALFPTKDFSALFALARSLDVPFTIHAGEAAGPESIEAALSFGAERLGHGVRVVESRQLLEKVIEKKIPLELCVTSNLQTKALPADIRYPLLDLLRRGVWVTVNTDNMTVSGTTIAHEFALLREMGMGAEEEKQLLLNAAEAAFLPVSEKVKLREIIERKLSCP